ncbi:MAG: hypothetical protein ACJ73D_08920 [Pyrinomonadaceae bacterium]
MRFVEDRWHSPKVTKLFLQVVAVVLLTLAALSIFTLLVGID